MYAANAANIGFVKNTGNAMDPFDGGWITRLESQGHTVTIFNQADGLNPAVATMNLFIVSQDVGSATAWSSFGNVTQPLFTYEYGIYDDIFGASGNGASAGLLTNGITISNPSHPLAAGLSGNVSIYTGAGGNGNISRYTGYGSGTPSPGAEVIAVSADFPANNIFAVLPAGAAGNGGATWPALRMALPCYDDWDPALVTADGWKLLDGAVAYALVPEPSSIALLGLGMAVLLARRQRR
jgi:hypothetical protein